MTGFDYFKTNRGLGLWCLIPLSTKANRTYIPVIQTFRNA